ncbi:glycosyltransferase [Luteipulveratus sp. YIM 133132]|uniref:glycosyltransferase n=1 Tax=Luteipulveratus flavus TaxID=3031728 RepID=UPI0023AEA967|nr:glycosyltransferase [Luteipulveratus sp. YIM 133132]MDE9367707.1 glycosyltransferase [Luteipulveratus sp. YIM 133132]
MTTTEWSVTADTHAPASLVVTAVLVVEHARSTWLEQTLGRLVDLHEAPERLVLVDATPERSVRAMVDASPGLRATYPDVSVVTVPPLSPFAAIVDTAVEALPRPGEDAVVGRRVRARARKRDIRPRDRQEWFWLLHEDSAPAPDALAALARVAGRSDRIGIAGCKVVELGRPERLVNVGVDVTRTGRHVGSAMEGEPDQGQYDDRHDVLAVSSAGMLIRRDVYLTLGGFDAAFDGDGDGLDLCWRTHLLGHQVVVVPAARVCQDTGGSTLDGDASDLRRHGDSDRPVPQSPRTLRRHRQVALARSSWSMLPFMALWVALGCTVLGLALLLVKRPRLALGELAQATAPFGVARLLGARLRFGRRAVTRRRDLDALFVPVGAATQHAWDAVRDAVSRGPRHPPLPAVETRPEPGPTADAAGELAAVHSTWGRRTARHPGLWMVVALLATTALMWRHLLTSAALRGTGQGLSGGLLLPYDTDAAGIWHTWWDHWTGPGLGVDLPESPYLPVLAGLARLVEALPWVDDTTSGATVVAWLLVLAVPLSGVSAYVAGRAATRSAWPRAFVGLAWASLPSLTAGVSAGRIGPVVGHVLLPLAVAGAFAVGRRSAGTPLTFGTVLVGALLGAFVPVLLVATTVIGLGVALLGTRLARVRGLVVAVGPWLLLGPWTFDRLRADSRALLAGSGALDSGRPAEPWQLLLLHPGGAGSYLALLSAPVLVLGLAALLRRRGGHVRVTTGLALLTLLGLGAALTASHVTLTAGAAGSRSPWPGPALDLTAAALLGAALLAFGDVLGRHGLGALPVRVRRAAVAGAAAVLGWAVVVCGVVAWSHDVRSLAPADPRLPPIAKHMSTGERATRMLTITVAGDGSVAYALGGSEPGTPARDLDVPERSSATLARGVASLLSPDTAASGAAHRDLFDLGVGFVGVTGSGDRTLLSRPLQSADGLSPMASNRTMSLWRVDAVASAASRASVPPGRVVLTLSGSPWASVASTGPHARTSTPLPSGPAGRRLTISESGGWARRTVVTVDDHRLPAVAGTVYPTYEVPAAGGHLQVEPGAAYLRWRWVQALLLAFTVFLAVPFGSSRSRRRP